MLNLILMFLGLTFPNSNASSLVANDHNHAVITPNNADPGDTGGETGKLPAR